jgi:hypothetical protein
MIEEAYGGVKPLRVTPVTLAHCLPVPDRIFDYATNAPGREFRGKAVRAYGQAWRVKKLGAAKKGDESDCAILAADRSEKKEETCL